ncbi:MAG: hypothetical protein M1398_04675 [Deltaproteobacteria bacterium]|nr:hypothetical protein [Deltaproteobacteria bacterium]
MSVKIYCDAGGFREELYQLQRTGVIDLMFFPYDNKMDREHELAPASAVTWNDCHLRWNEIDSAWDDLKASDKYESIRKIIGRPRRDALHIDSAFKAGCRAFLTRDKKDILTKARELEELLDIKFLHTDEQWGDFLALLGA